MQSIVSIQFDDGNDSDAWVAEALGIPITAYVVTSTIGNAGKLTWEDIGRLLVQGHTVASHGYTHVRAPELGAVDLAQHLRLPRRTFRLRVPSPSPLPLPLRHYGPPHGDCDERVLAAALSAGYYTVRASRMEHSYIPGATMLTQSMEERQPWGDIQAAIDLARDCDNTLMCLVAHRIYPDDYQTEHTHLSHVKRVRDAVYAAGLELVSMDRAWQLCKQNEGS